MATKRATAPRMSAEDRRYQARDDLRTLQRAQEIQKDKARVTAATKEAQTQVKTIQAVIGKK